MKNGVQMQDKYGNWIEAVEESYHPSLIEKIKHSLFNKHVFAFSHLNQICDSWFVGTVRVDECLMCLERIESIFHSSRPLSREETERKRPDLISLQKKI